jgi:hypothetical protein
MYSKYPQRMLSARAKSYLARDVYPDILHGIASYEELSDLQEHAIDVGDLSAPPEPVESEADPSDSGIEDADFSAEEQTPESGFDLDRILSSKSLGELDSLRPELNALPKGSEIRTKAKELFVKQAETLKKAGDSK